MKNCTKRLLKEIMQNNKEWQAAYSVIEQLEYAGFEAVIVGGAVRDAILGRPAHDVDVATNAMPDEVKSIFDRTVDIGIQHGTVLVIVPAGSVEVTTYRTDGEYTDHRRPEEVQFVRSLKEDLQRRDFTMNAIAMRRDGSFVDFMEDAKILRLVSFELLVTHRNVFRKMHYECYGPYVFQHSSVFN